ncbi:hypothetical protein BGZ96_004742 [Linnemannia gamsii]|uniref:MICOS complex subunit n=1 Tax=Linnemannia gamsii TaxID=64522 RepID=A0ABQ7KFE7_9FUNG|nr:hypothetical protein BGZ96_004742 [Linnemannia gamsii]
MVHPVPITIAAATALVASSARASLNPVYADESEDQSGFDHDHRASLYPHLVNRSEIRPEEAKSNFRREAYSRSYNHANTRSVIAPEEDLFPGVAYVAIAGLTGFLVARQRGTLLKALSPVAFASATGYYFLPHTTRNLLGVDQPSYDKWTASHASSSSPPRSSTSPLPRAELASKAREAWHTAEVRAEKIDSKIDNKTQEVKSWWNNNSSIAEDTIKAQVNDIKTRASDAVDNAKNWAEDKSRLVERTIQSTSSSIPSGSSSLKSETDKARLHHDQELHPEPSTHSFKHWYSSRSSTSGPESHDHWSTGEEQGTSTIREDEGYWIRRAGFDSNAGLDNKDVDVWSSTNEEIGTARMDETPYANSHRNINIEGRLPHETEYWTNGEEMSSADVRDPKYYNWPDSRNSTSLGRSSWWDPRFRSSPIDLDASTSIRFRTESAAWESKQAAERSALNLANRLANERDQKAAYEAKVRAETEVMQMKLAAERAAKAVRESEIRLTRELEEIAAMGKKRAAERTSKESADRLAFEKAEAHAAKNRAESNLAEKKRAAELSARETSNLISREHTARLEREARLRSQSDDMKTKMHDTAPSDSSSSSSSSWSWPWSRSSTTTTTTTKDTHDHDGSDSTGHLLDQIVEDIKQTKDDLSGGLHHLKDAVLGAEAKATEATVKSKETLVEAVNAAKPESRSWWSSGSSSPSSYSTSTPDISTKVSDLGTNIERVAVKAERDVKAKTETIGRDLADTSRKAYDNVIDAATTAEGQRTYSHHHHEHPDSSTDHDGHTLMDHLRDDFQSSKESLQSGVDSLKETVFEADQAANKATSDIQEGIKQATDEGQRWWSAKTHEAEKSANQLESELRAGLNKASDKIREVDNSLNNASGREASDDDFWFHAEQARQQKSRRGSGRAM